MYEFIRGKLVGITDEEAIIDVGGVGFKLLVPMHAKTKVPLEGKEVLFHVSFIVREAAHSLFGFIEKGERDLFEILIGLSGVGPKTALSLISHLPLAQFQEAIFTQNLVTLSKVPGIGKKTAERLIMELKGKKGTFLLSTSSTQENGTQKKLSHLQDALQALLNLGFSHASAETALKKALEENPDETDLSILIASALRLQKTSRS